MSEAPGDEPQRRMPRACRITTGSDIRSLLQRGKRSRTAHLDVFDSESPFLHPRVGVIVPRHKHTAVRRNRLKRQLREILRVELLPLLGAAEKKPDVLVRARREAYDAAFGELREELLGWVDRRWLPSSSSS